MADTKLSEIAAAGAIVGANTIIGVQGGTTDVQYTVTNMASAISSILGLTALATTSPGTGVVTALGINVGSVGAFVVFNGAGGTPSSMTGTNISGTAAGLTAGAATILATARAIYGNNFDGSAALTQIIASTFGGTGNGFTKFSGPTTSEKTFTLPNASATVLTDNAVVTAAQGGTGQTSYTKGDLLVTPGSTTLNKLAVGTDGFVLTADAASTNGVKWAAGGGGSSTITANSTLTSGFSAGQLLYSDGTKVQAGAATLSGNNLTINSTGILKLGSQGIYFDSGGSYELYQNSSTDIDFYMGGHFFVMDGIGGGKTASFTRATRLGWSDTPASDGTIDAMWSSPGAAVIQRGAADTDLNSAIVAQTFRTQGALAGGTSNQAGKNYTMLISPGKGTGAGGSLIIQTTPAGSTGTTVNAGVARLTIDGPGNVVVGSAALATSVTDGFLYIPTCAGAPVGTPTTYTGRVALMYDTTNHQFWIYDAAWLQPKTPAGAATVTWQ